MHCSLTNTECLFQPGVYSSLVSVSGSLPRPPTIFRTLCTTSHHHIYIVYFIKRCYERYLSPSSVINYSYDSDETSRYVEVARFLTTFGDSCTPVVIKVFLLPTVGVVLVRVFSLEVPINWYKDTQAFTCVVYG